MVETYFLITFVLLGPFFPFFLASRGVPWVVSFLLPSRVASELPRLIKPSYRVVRIRRVREVCSSSSGSSGVEEGRVFY